MRIVLKCLWRISGKYFSCIRRIRRKYFSVLEEYDEVWVVCGTQIRLRIREKLVKLI
jgi:hypothetical protein